MSGARAALAAFLSALGARDAAPKPDPVGPLPQRAERGLRRLLAETPVPPGRLARDLAIARIDDFAFAKNAILSLPDIRWPESIRYGFVTVEDAVVTPSGFVIAQDRLVFDTQMLPQGWMRGLHGGAPELIDRVFGQNFIHKFDPWRETCRLSLPAEMPEIEAPAFLFNSRLACFNFAHLVHDTLIQTPTYADCRDHLGTAVVPALAGPGFPFPVWGEILARALGPDAPAPMFLANRFLRFRRLHVPTTHFRPNEAAIARGAAMRVRATLARSLRPYRRPQARRLFISRADSGRNSEREPRFANGEAFAGSLAKLGIEPVVASRLDPDEYLAVFVNAELIVGLHGAGVANALLSAEPRLVELTVPGYPDWRSLALFVETGMGAPYARVTHAPPADGVAHYEIPRIVEACEALLATPCPEPALAL